MALLPILFIDGQGQTYTWQQVRHFHEKMAGVVQEGAVEAGDFKVTARPTGMGLDVAAGDAAVRMDTGTRNGFYLCTNDAALENVVTIPAADATNPRVDRVVLRARDPNVNASAGQTTPLLELLQGTPTAAADVAAGLNAANGYGAAGGAQAVGNDRLLLADVYVPANAGSAAACTIRDRRKRARGAYQHIVRNANAGGSNDYTTAGTVSAALDATNLAPRHELSGAPVRIKLRGTASHDLASGLIFELRIDDATVNGGPRFSYDATAAFPLSIEWDAIPTPGSRRITPHWWVGTGVGTLLARAANPVELVVEELVRPNASNA